MFAPCGSVMTKVKFCGPKPLPAFGVRLVSGIQVTHLGNCAMYPGAYKVER